MCGAEGCTYCGAGGCTCAARGVTRAVRAGGVSAWACENECVSTAPQSPQQPEPATSTSSDEVRVRRAPKYPVFIFAGVILGVVVTFVAVALAPGNGDGTPFLQAFGYFVLYGIALGALLGAIVAVILDGIANRRARSIATERTVVETPEATETPEAAETRAAAETRGPAETREALEPIDGELE